MPPSSLPLHATSHGRRLLDTGHVRLRFDRMSADVTPGVVIGSHLDPVPDGSHSPAERARPQHCHDGVMALTAAVTELLNDPKRSTGARE